MADPQHPQVRDLEEARVHIAVLYDQIADLHCRVARQDEEIDMCFRTPYYKRVWFALNGWPMHRVIQQHEQGERFWHRWFGRP